MRFNPFNKAAFRYWRTALILVLIPVLELGLLLLLFNKWFVVLSVLIGGLLGAYLAHRAGVRCWIEFNRQLDRGEIPTVSALNGVLILVAALLLTLPGLLTSLFGLVLFVPLTRTFIISYLVLFFESHRLQTQQKDTPSSPEIIDI
jgi:UPF0716 protein FxsA